MKIKYLFLSLLLAAATAVAMPAVAAESPAASGQPQGSANEVFVDPGLKAHLAKRDSVRMLIYMRERADLSPAFDMGWEERGEFVYKTLKDLADRTQAAVRSELDSLGADYRPFWIDNVIAVTNTDMSMINSLQSHSEIQAMVVEPVAHLPDPEDASISEGAAINAVESSVAQINAPDAWAQGHKGQGAVVGIIDSGSRYSHEALVNQYRGNLGGGSFDHNYNWFDVGGSTEPQWPNPHGTHVTGTAIGDNGTDQQIGVAPEADWISCLGCTSTGCPGANLLACGEFMAAPTDLNGNNPDPSLRANVVNNSWGDCGTSLDGWYQGTVDAWIAAGVVPVVSNGNASNCGYSQPPGLNTVGNPARYGSVLGIGSSGKNNGQYASHSNWGPTDDPNAGTDSSLPDPNGYPDLKPNVVAPGVGICSSVSSGDTNYSCSYTGTSMSSPAATGTIALMISAAPSLAGDYATLGTLLMETANPIPYDTGTGDEGPGLVPNYATGWGEIDALAAVQAAIAASGPQGTLTGTVTDQGSGLPVNGAEVTITNQASPPEEWTATTDASGQFSEDLVVDTYDVDVTAYGYQAGSETGVAITENQTTSISVALTAAPDHQVAGLVTDNDTGWPLHAEVEIDGYPNSPIYTDPADGSYSVTLPEGMDFDFTVSAMPDGYEFETRTIASLTADATEDFALEADPVACDAPGYDDAPSTLLSESFDTTSMPTGWTVEDYDGGGDVWQFDNPGGRDNETGGSGNFAVADSDNSGSGASLNTGLLTPVFDLSSAANADLEFKYDFRALSSDVASVDVTTDGGTTWTTEWSLSSADRGPKTATVSLADYAGNPTVQVRFVYESGWSYWWQVDDVEVIVYNPCSAESGELLTGVVTDANDGQPINDATVAVDSTSHEATTGPNPDLGDGSYYLFVPAGAQDVIASADGYSDNTLSDTFVDGEARRADFALDAGQLSVLPESMSTDVVFGQTADEALILVNDGTELVDVNVIPVAGLEEDFETDFPPAGWSLEELAASECQWMRNDDYGTPNYAGGDGFAAAADAGSCGLFAYMDVALVSPEFPVDSSSDLNFILSFKTFQTDQFDVDITTDGGSSWTNLQSWDSNVSPDGPGVAQSISLGAHAGQTAQIRFRYLSDWGYHAHVDQVEITGNADWLSVSPDTGTFANGPVQLQYDTLNSTVTFDASAPSVTEPGIYTAALLVENDTPYGDITVPVEMNVLPAVDQAQITGTVTSLGYCDDEPQPLPGADVRLVGQNNNYTLTTDANGEYAMWLDAGESPLAIKVQASDHVEKTVSGIALTGGDTTVEDIDVRLEAACPGVAPDSLSVNLLPDESSTETITLSNSGTIDLGWDTDTAPGVNVTAGEGGSYVPGSGSSLNSDSAVDLQSLYGGELPTIEGFAHVNAIDCDTADYLVIHDGGEIDNGYGANPDTVDEVSFVEYYEPGQHPAMLGEVCVSFITTGPDTSQDFELVVFDDDGTGGAPGTELGSVSATANDIPGGGLPTAVPWASVDVSSLDLTIDSGGVYIGVRFDPAAPGDVFLASDESSAQQTGFWKVDGDPWEDVLADAYPDYSAFFVRPQMIPATGCVNPSEVPWLSVSPASGTTAPGNSSDIDVTVDSSGLLPDVYEAEVCVLTDDPNTSIIGVPVTLTVDAPAGFGTISGSVEGLGYCSANPQPAAGATIEFIGQSNTYTTTVDANGDYSITLDSAEAPVDMTASYTGYLDGVETGVAITAGDTTTIDFALELDAACATPTPASLGDSLEPGQSSTQVITLANEGAADLNWTIEEAEPLTVVGGIEGNAGDGVAAATPENAIDMRSGYGGELPTIEGFPGVNAIDCSSAPDLVIHDDGSIENGYSGNAENVSSVSIVEHFEPNAYPAGLGEVCISFITTNTSNVDLNFELVVYADDGTGGAPGTELGAVTATATDIPGGGIPGTVPWYTVDLSGLDVAIQSGGVYIGARYAPVDPGIFVAADQAPATPQQTGYFRTDGDSWSEISDPSLFPDYRAMFIRPQMPQVGCMSPGDVPWLSIAPLSGVTAPGESADIDVTVDASGLSVGLYEALVCINSDDPEQPIISVPYSLDVSSDLIFEDRFEQ